MDKVQVIISLEGAQSISEVLRVQELTDLADQVSIGIREYLKAQIRRYKSYTSAQIEEYFSEAEHQEGYEYWDQFDLKSLSEDMRLYFTSK